MVGTTSSVLLSPLSVTSNQCLLKVNESEPEGLRLTMSLLQIFLGHDLIGGFVTTYNGLESVFLEG